MYSSRAYYGTVMEIWPFEDFPGRLCQETKSVSHDDAVGRQYYTDLIFSSSVGLR